MTNIAKSEHFKEFIPILLYTNHNCSNVETYGSLKYDNFLKYGSFFMSVTAFLRRSFTKSVEKPVFCNQDYSI